MRRGDYALALSEKNRSAAAILLRRSFQYVPEDPNSTEFQVTHGIECLAWAARANLPELTSEFFHSLAPKIEKLHLQRQPLERLRAARALVMPPIECDDFEPWSMAGGQRVEFF